MLLRFDPFRELDRTVSHTGAARPAPVPLDAYRLGDRLFVHVDLPGIDPTGVEVTVEKNVLTITAERRRPRREGVDLLVGERPYGRFARQLFLGDGLDTDRVEAAYDAGVLSITIPVAEASKPRKIDVAIGQGAQPAVEATITEPELASVN